jgi:hypothetical protein
MKTNFKLNTQLIAFACMLLVIVFLLSGKCRQYKYIIRANRTFYKTDEYKIKNNCIYFKQNVGIWENKFIDVIFCDGFSVVPSN